MVDRESMFDDLPVDSETGIATGRKVAFTIQIGPDADVFMFSTDVVAPVLRQIADAIEAGVKGNIEYEESVYLVGNDVHVDVRMKALDSPGFLPDEENYQIEVSEEVDASTYATLSNAELEAIRG